MTPLFRPVWWQAQLSSFSSSRRAAPGYRWLRASPVASPTMPPPTIAKSATSRIRRGTARGMRKHDRSVPDLDDSKPGARDHLQRLPALQTIGIEVRVQSEHAL